MGSISQLVAIKFSPFKKFRHPKYFVSSTLVCGSFGSFVGSLSAGKNSIQYIGDIFRDNSKPSSLYISQLNENEKQIRMTAEETFKRRQEAIAKATQQKKISDQSWN